MNKAEELSKLIGVPVEYINEIDKGMWDILIELNKKGYYTVYSCEGHCNPKPDKKGKIGYWNGYLAFVNTYKFPIYPPKFYKVNSKRRFFYWDGYGEESRKEYLDNVLKWAVTLPTREKKCVTMYHLLAKNKTQPNREAKSLAYTEDYEEIKCILNRADMDKYFDFQLYEDIKYI